MKFQKPSGCLQLNDEVSMFLQFFFFLKNHKVFVGRREEFQQQLNLSLPACEPAGWD